MAQFRDGQLSALFRTRSGYRLAFECRVIPYSALEACNTILRPWAIHRLVNFEGKTFVLKTDDFPGDEDRLAQELTSYNNDIRIIGPRKQHWD